MRPHPVSYPVNQPIGKIFPNERDYLKSIIKKPLDKKALEVPPPEVRRLVGEYIADELLESPQDPPRPRSRLIRSIAYKIYSDLFPRNKVNEGDIDKIEKLVGSILIGPGSSSLPQFPNHGESVFFKG